MALAKQTAHRPSRARKEDQTDISEWFVGAPSLLITEEAITLGAHGVLTVLPALALPSADHTEYERRNADERPGDWRDAMRTFRWDDPNDPDL